MTWKVNYHPKVADDLDALGHDNANKLLDVIEQRIIKGDPEKAGKPLRKKLAGCRRIRTGDMRIIYKVFKNEVTVYVVAVGMRRKKEPYKTAQKRKLKAPAKKKAIKKKAAKKKSARKPK